MTERGRGTGGRPMIYGKTPESRRYWEKSVQEEAKRGAPEREQTEKKENGRTRLRSYGTQQKLKILWGIFGLLCVLLVAAILYEVVLGNGTKLPGSKRITQPTRQEQNKETSGISVQKTQIQTEKPAEETQADPARTQATDGAVTVAETENAGEKDTQPET